MTPPAKGCKTGCRVSPVTQYKLILTDGQQLPGNTAKDERERKLRMTRAATSALLLRVALHFTLDLISSNSTPPPEDRAARTGVIPHEFIWITERGPAAVGVVCGNDESRLWIQ